MEGKTIRLKLSVGGLPNVGKTSIVNRVVLGSFTADYATTIGVDFRIKEYQVGSITAKTYIWDQCGAERFSALKYLYMKSKNDLIKNLMPSVSVSVSIKGGPFRNSQSS